MTCRCFVALDLPDGIRQSALEAQQALRLKYPDLRYTSGQNLHLTLKFLGDISSERQGQVKERLQAVRGAPFAIRLAEAGCFSPNIVWLALQGADGLQRQVDAALAPWFPLEHRFMGHVTIARAKRMPEQFRRDLEALALPASMAEATSFSLQESRLDHLGPQYDTLARYEL